MSALAFYFKSKGQASNSLFSEEDSQTFFFLNLFRSNAFSPIQVLGISFLTSLHPLQAFIAALRLSVQRSGCFANYYRI